MIDFSGYTDEELIYSYKNHNNESFLDELILRYDNLVLYCATSLFLIGAEKEDLVQEGKVGLLNAINSFDPDKNEKFFPFAKICIKRAQYKAIEAATRKKHSPLNESYSLDAGLEEVNGYYMETKVSSPEDIIFEQYEIKEITDKIKKKLSENETQVLHLLLKGSDYKSIASDLNKSPKSIDNTIQRIRKKVSEII